MRWQLRGGDWPVGPMLIPAGSVISDDGDPAAIPLAGVPTPLPITAVALDDDAGHQMCLWYEETNSIGGWHALHFHHTVDREKVMAQARHKKRWPNGEPTQAMADYTHPPQEEKPQEEKPRRRRR
jgi:hypothetical protein